MGVTPYLSIDSVNLAVHQDIISQLMMHYYSHYLTADNVLAIQAEIRL